ncbi:MAG: response regulator [Gammaproteobacteria bacterium]|nr:MAG: response regulator [Gammaproteobacteria bacterium]
MEININFCLEHLERLNNLSQNWSDNENQEPDKLSELLLEFDLVINQLKDHANKNNDIELEDLYTQFQNNLIVFYESVASEKQIELICAWPVYFSEFISNRQDEETIVGLIEFLCDPDWPYAYSSEHNHTTQSNADTLVLQTEIPESLVEPESKIERPPEESTNLSAEQQEFLNLINAEIVDIQASHTERLTTLIESSERKESDLQDELDTQIDQLERIGSASEMVGLRGLKKFCKQIHKFLSHVRDSDINQLTTLIEPLLDWPDIIQAYLFAPEDSDYILAALDYLNLDCWPIQLTPVEQKDFEDAFYSSKIEGDTSQTLSRIRDATLENINLNKPEDVPEELFDSLLQDLPDQTAEFSLAVQHLRGHDYLKQLEISKRIAHTLKGAGNTVGIQGLANLTHHLEDILDALLKENEKPSHKLHSVLENAADCLEEMSEHLHGMGQAPEETLQILQEVLNWANHIDEHGIPAENDSFNYNHESTANKIENSETPINITSKIEDDEKEKESQVEQSLRIATSLVDDLLKRADENIISNAQMQEYILRSKTFAKQLRSNNHKIKNLVNELEHLIEVRGFSSQFSPKNKQDKFDPLEMDKFNELNTYSNLLIEAAADSNEFAMSIEASLLKLENLSTVQRRILLENQEAVLRTRMVPIKSITQRLKRCVKQANKLSNKSAQLKIVGENILIDSDILNQLVDPLMHILRNAIDHGIEPAESRKQQGKTEGGSVNLRFHKKGKQIYISCEDDGRGLDIDRIKSKALEMGLLHEDIAFEKEDALKLILQHGFSTKEEISQLSGRGVGLDVVFADVRDLKGSVSMNTHYGVGTKIELSIPMTFHSTQALLVSCANNTLALSNRGVEEILHPGAGSIISKQNMPFFAYKQKHYPIFNLQNVLFNEHKIESDDPSQAVLIIKDEFDNSHAILIDKILDSREIVVKPFSRFIPKMSGLLGSTIIGDGSVISVLDLLDIVNIADPSILRSRNIKKKQSEHVNNIHALIVEDAISTRKSLAQFMTDLGFNVATAKDGVEAIDIIQKQLPSIILTDLEMPRMNGLELTDHLRSNKETENTPIIMITSRATDKHKKEAHRIGVTEYMTKPYDEDILLNIINKLSITA